jgi:hypothetical protein
MNMENRWGAGSRRLRTQSNEADRSYGMALIEKETV